VRQKKTRHSQIVTSNANDQSVQNDMMSLRGQQVQMSISS